jgi:AcrR family transcriptional regulator
MARWEPDARGRLKSAALELYGERGFEQTTALEIAQRAGVTERTFFRYFADKREVLFEGSSELQEVIVRAISEAPTSMASIESVGAAMEGAGVLLEKNRDRDYARQRAAVIAANPSLHERELLKFATLAAAAADALRRRGVADLTAGLAAETGVTVFKVGFETWIGDDPTGDLAHCIREALDELKGLTAGA